MKRNEFFEVNCAINKNERLCLQLPYRVHADFERTITSGDDRLMARLVELFAEYSALDAVKRQTFQTLIVQKADSLYTLDDLLTCLRAVRLCDILNGSK